MYKRSKLVRFMEKLTPGSGISFYNAFRKFFKYLFLIKPSSYFMRITTFHHDTYLLFIICTILNFFVHALIITLLIYAICIIDNLWINIVLGAFIGNSFGTLGFLGHEILHGTVYTVPCKISCPRNPKVPKLLPINAPRTIFIHKLSIMHIAYISKVIIKACTKKFNIVQIINNK